MTDVKICGLSTPETLTTAIEGGAKFIGLVFHPDSPRHVDIEVARYLAKSVPDSVEVAGLFVNPNDPTLMEVLTEVPLSMIQLHGGEAPTRVREVKELTGLPVIKAIPIEDRGDIMRAELYEGIADWILFDAKGEELPGGNGRPFDWTILEGYSGGTPWMLAGGLTPENVGDALKILSPSAVDVSSGVESSKGMKDSGKIRAFIEAVKKA